MGDLLRFKRKPNSLTTHAFIAAQASLLADMKQKFLHLKGEVARLRARYDSSSNDSAVQNSQQYSGDRSRPAQPSARLKSVITTSRKRKH